MKVQAKYYFKIKFDKEKNMEKLAKTYLHNNIDTYMSSLNVMNDHFSYSYIKPNNLVDVL